MPVRKTCILILAYILLFACKPDRGEIIPLWKGSAPGSEHLSMQESSSQMDVNIFKSNRAIRQITHPTLEAFVPGHPNGTAVILCPGGGYWLLAYDREGVNVAKWFNSIGVTAFVLKYRLPAEGHHDRRNVPLQDAQRALRLVRANASKWNVNPNRIGIFGTSAGGHLAAMLGTAYNRNVYVPTDAADSVSARPDFMILLYPVITMDSILTHPGSREALLGKNPSQELVFNYSADRLIDDESPPAFIAFAENDPLVSPINGELFYHSLRASGVSTEIHIFKNGGHGFGVKKRNPAAQKWPNLCRKWLRSVKLID